jgi:hypothetical protein
VSVSGGGGTGVCVSGGGGGGVSVAGIEAGASEVLIGAGDRADSLVGMVARFSVGVSWRTGSVGLRSAGPLLFLAAQPIRMAARMIEQSEKIHLRDISLLRLDAQPRHTS